MEAWDFASSFNDNTSLPHKWLPYHWLAFACILQLILIIIVVNILNYNPHYDYGNAFVTPLFAPHVAITQPYFELQLNS